MKNVAVSAVVGMGLLIIIITIFIIYGLIQKSDDPDFKFFDLATESVPEPEPTVQAVQTPAPAAPLMPAKAMGDLRFELPAGFVIKGTDMGHNRLLLRLENAAGETRLMILDLNTGAKLGTISLSPPASAQ